MIFEVLMSFLNFRLGSDIGDILTFLFDNLTKGCEIIINFIAYYRIILDFFNLNVDSLFFFIYFKFKSESIFKSVEFCS